jgi:hypothetical protein
MFTCFPLLLSASDLQTKTPSAHLSVAEIVDRNAAARGGLATWRTVQTLEMKGKLDAGGNNRAGISVPGVRTDAAMPPARPSEQTQLPFVIDLARGRKSRLEIEFNGQTAVQVYNGTQGWKLRPFLNRHQVENYTADELKTASQNADLDGYLIDYAAKGEKIEVEGVESVEGHDAYKLKVTDKTGYAHHIWIDAGSFLEVKMEGTPRRLDGKMHAVSIYMRDYQTVNGLMMPHLLETRVEGVRDIERIRVESIIANPKLDDSKFAMPR